MEKEKFVPASNLLAGKKAWNKKIIISLVAIFILIIGVATFGIYEGFMVRAYVHDVDQIITDSNNLWADNSVNSDTNNISDVKTRLEVIQIDADKQLKKLENLDAPLKTVYLEEKVRDYFGVAKNISTDTLVVIEYINIWNKVNDDFNNAELELDEIKNNTEAVEILETTQAEIDKIIKKMQSAENIPESYKDFHIQYLKDLQGLLKLNVEMLDLIKKDELAKVDSTLDEYKAKADKISKTSFPNSDDVIGQITTTEQKNKFTNDPVEIENNINDLSGIWFCIGSFGF